MTIPAAISGFNIAIPTRSRIAKIHKTTFNIISPYQITKDCNNKFKKNYSLKFNFTQKLYSDMDALSTLS